MTLQAERAETDQTPWHRTADRLQIGSAWLAILIPAYVIAATIVMRQRSSLPPHQHAGFFSRVYLFPEPHERLTYLVLLTAPLVLAALTISSARWERGASSNRLVMVAAATGQVLLLALLLACIPAQVDIYGYFSVGAVATAVAAGVAAAAVVVAGPEFSPDNVLVRALQTRGKLSRAVATTFATIAGLLVTTGLYTDSSITAATPNTIFHLPFTSEEYAAVLNGATPLVDFVPQYNFSLPYLFAPFFQLLGGVTTASFTLVMTLFSLVAMMAVYIALRLTTQSPLGALLLFLAFVAISLCPVLVDTHRMENIASYYALMPMRYGLPLLMAPAVVAAANGSRKASVLLSVLAAITVVNNLDFGLPAFGAVVVAFWCQARFRGRLPWREISHLVASTLVAVASIAVLAHARTGSWPDFGRMLYYPRLFAVEGFFMVPVPGAFGLHMIMFLTFAGGLAVALLIAVRRIGEDESVTGRVALLAYSSTFGLGTGMYYIGRSDYRVLGGLFCAWGLCLVSIAVLLAPQLPAVTRLPLRLRVLAVPTIAAVTASLTLALTTLPMQSTVWAPARGDSGSGAPSVKDLAMQKLIRDCSEPRSSVMMIYVNGYRVASASHRRNWFPYASPFDVVTYRQLGDIRRILDRHVVTQIFTSDDSLVPELRRMLLTQGWTVSDRRTTTSDHLLSWRRSIDPASGASYPTGGECGRNS